MSNITRSLLSQTEALGLLRDGLLSEITFAKSRGGLIFKIGFFSKLSPEIKPTWHLFDVLRYVEVTD